MASLAALLALVACSRRAVEGIEIDQSLLNWSTEGAVIVGEVVLRNSGKHSVVGTLELICELDLKKIELKSLNTFVGDNPEEWLEILTARKDELNPLLKAVLRYVKEKPEFDWGETWDVELSDPEEPTYVFSFYAEVHLLPGSVNRVGVSSPVPGFLYGRAHSLSVGSLVQKSD